MVFVVETALTTFLGIHVPHFFPFCCFVDPYTAAGAGAAYHGPCGICCVPAAEAGSAPALCCIAWCCPAVAAGVAHEQLSQHVLVDEDEGKNKKSSDDDDKNSEASTQTQEATPLVRIPLTGRTTSIHSLGDDLEADEE